MGTRRSHLEPMERCSPGRLRAVGRGLGSARCCALFPNRRRPQGMKKSEINANGSAIANCYCKSNRHCICFAGNANCAMKCTELSSTRLLSRDFGGGGGGRQREKEREICLIWRIFYVYFCLALHALHAAFGPGLCEGQIQGSGWR